MKRPLRKSIHLRLLLFPGMGGFNRHVATTRSRPDSPVEQSAPSGPPAVTLDQVGARLRRIREWRGLKLTEAAEGVNVSKSTLSRLENGQRRAGLELLLPLARLYRVPLGELVGAPETGDPRIRPQPHQINGRTVLNVGEAAEFDTQVPHWFGSTGDGPAEVLSIFGRPGERLPIRADGSSSHAHPDPHPT